MIKLFSLILLASFTLMQCNDANPDPSDACPNAELFTIKNFAGLDGCSYVLVQGDKSFEPINLEDFVAEPTEDQTVMFEIVVREDMASICMVGTIIEITCQK